MVRTRWSGLLPERRKALVRASVLLIGAVLFVLGLTVNGVNLLLFVGTVLIVLASGVNLVTMDGLLDYRKLGRNTKIAYWVALFLFWPIPVALVFGLGIKRLIQEWQSAPALVSARIAELEQTLAEPTKE